MILGIPLLQLFVTLPLELDLFVLFCISFGTPLFQVLVPVLLLPGCNISYGTPFPVVVP